MGFQYKRVLVVGATSGIGLALADRLVEDGVKVIAVGRRKERLDEFTHKHGEDKASAIQFDITTLDKIPQFAKEVTEAYPDLDCVFLNAGTQNRLDLADLTQFNVDAIQQEILVNFISYVALTRAFLPFFQGKDSQTSFIFTGTNLSIVPAAVLPGYSASKAALNSFVLCLREQLRNSPIRVIELSPPVVQTELHDYLGEEVGRSMGMPVDQYINDTYARIVAGEDQIVLGSIGPAETFNEVLNKRRELFTNLAKMMRGGKP